MRFIKNYFFSILFIFLILYASTATSSSLPKVPVFKGMDKIVHFFMYFVLTLALFFETPQTGSIKRYLIVLALPVLYGGLMEIMQHYFFSPRTGDWFDFLANSAGVLVAYLAGSCLAKTNVMKKRLKH